MTEVSRRGLLTGAGALAGIGVLGLSAEAAAARPASRLVVVFLRGGLDGLSLLAPIGEHAYAAARPTIAVPARQALPADRFWGWHPKATGLAELYRRGQLAPVVAVAPKESTRSHFEAIERLETCSTASRPLRTGWLDRYAQKAGLTGTFSTVVAGTGSPRSLAGSAPELQVPSVDAFALEAVGPREPFLAALRALNADSTAAARQLRVAMEAERTLTRLRGRALGGYPQTFLGNRLHDIATMIRSGLDVQVATADFGGWDMHEGLGAHADGWMGRQVDDLSRSISAFAKDLGREWARTTLVVMSEFGRQVVENGNGGVDHGVGATWLVAGGRVRGGRVHGAWPTLSPKARDDGGVAGRVEQRRLLAEVLGDGCGASAATVRAALPGARAAGLGLFR